MLRLEYRLLRSVDDLAGQLPAGESDLPSAAHADSVPAETVPPRLPRRPLSCRHRR